MPIREIVRVRIPELKLQIALPDMPDAEVDSLRQALAARPRLDDRVELMCAVSDFHRLPIPGRVQ